MAKFKKRNLKRLISTVLVVVLVAALCGTLISVLTNAANTIHPSFAVGALDNNGKHVADEQSIYTKKAFECVGLRIEPDFDAHVTYDVYYYDEDESFLLARKGLSEVHDEDFPFAKYARIVIHPEAPVGTAQKDFKIKWYQVTGYANSIKISVDRKQDYNNGSVLTSKAYGYNLYDDSKAKLNSGFYATKGQNISFGYDDEPFRNMKISEKLDVSRYNYVDIVFRSNGEIISFDSAVVSGTDVVLNNTTYNRSDYPDTYKSGDWAVFTLDLMDLKASNTTLYLYLNMYKAAECYVYGY